MCILGSGFDDLKQVEKMLPYNLRLPYIPILYMRDGQQSLTSSVSLVFYVRLHNGPVTMLFRLMQYCFTSGICAALAHAPNFTFISLTICKPLHRNKRHVPPVACYSGTCLVRKQQPKGESVMIHLVDLNLYTLKDPTVWGYTLFFLLCEGV